MSYTHFTVEERKYLQDLLSQGYSMRKIADYLGRSPSSVSREINRNKSKRNKKENVNQYRYHHWRAEILAKIRKKTACRKAAIVINSELYYFIIDKLQHFWSPETIAAVWRQNHPDSTLATSTIYRYIKKKFFPSISCKEHLRRRGKKRQTKNALYNTIHPDRTVNDWTDEIKYRLSHGHWEGDTVHGGIGKGYIVTLVDRKTRFLIAGLLPKKSATLTREVIYSLLKKTPTKSLTFDNGSEFADFKLMEKDLNTLVYFAEPHKPWQRGTNENTNDILRFFFPKGFNFHSITQEILDNVVDLINNRPRKCLGWKTPLEVFLECCT